jgi:hypothetical protein
LHGFQDEEGKGGKCRAWVADRQTTFIEIARSPFALPLVEKVAVSTGIAANFLILETNDGLLYNI